jgi:antirestriction protein ArdC/KaiC/GvpD/RAD55 family RecA-like ATPase
MNTASKFNGLNGTIVTRDTLENLLLEAERLEQSNIANRIRVILANYPLVRNFDFSIENEAIDEMPASILECLDCETENHETIFGLGKAVSPNDIYDQITNMVIEMLDKDIDFEQEWNSLESGYNFAYNFVSKKPYRGINQFLLGSKKVYDPTQPLLQNPYFLTFEQIKELKGKLIKGSKAKMVIYYIQLFQYEQAEPKLQFSTYDVKKFIAWAYANKSKINVLNGGNALTVESFTNQSLVPILKYYNVFSAVDVEGIDFDLENFAGKGKIVGIDGNHHEKLEVAEAIIKNYPAPMPTLRYGGDRAFYRPSQDLVQMPELKQFNFVQAYYTVFFHELIHSTGSKDRLNRTKGKEHGDKDYAFEELVAELGAMFLCAESGILHYTKRNSAAYLKSWREALLEEIKKDNRFFFRASSQAQKAVDFMLDRNADGIAAYENLIESILPEIKTIKSQPKPKTKVVKIDKPVTETKEEKFLKEYNSIKSKYKNEVVLVRSDNFYIAIGDDAKIIHIVLGVEKRTVNKNVISGFVASQVDEAKVELVKAGYKIILSDEIKEDKPIQTKVREHKRVLIDTPNHHHFTYFVYRKKNEVGKNIFFSMINGERIGNIEHATKLEAQNSAVEWIENYIANKNKTAHKPKVNKVTKQISLFGEKKPKAKLNGIVDNLVVNAITSVALAEPEQVTETFSSNSKIKKIGERSVEKSEFYTVNGEVGKFLQAVEKKPFESVVITLDGEQGAGKTTTLYKFMDGFASAGNKSLFLSLEEHTDSDLANQKTQKYISSTAKKYLDATSEVSSKEELYQMVNDYDIIFIDSWQKLQRMIGDIKLDEDLRKKFNGKVFVIIFQQTTTGRTKGGAEVVFDGDIIIKMVKENSFADNYAYFDKNRYTKIAIEDIRYNIASGKTYNPNAPKETKPPTNKHQFSFQVN